MKVFFVLMTICLTFFSSRTWASVYPQSVDLMALAKKENQGLTALQISAENLTRYKAFIKLNVNTEKNDPFFFKDIKKPKTITIHQANKALDAAETNIVVSLNQYHVYDPKNQGIGFCFGRAMFIHLYLASAGFSRANIKKAFIIGPMNRGEWGWHVTTIVESRDSSGNEIWLALDPLKYQALDLKVWFKDMQQLSDDGKLRLYITDAAKFGPLPSKYDENNAINPFYNNYFQDMMRWFEQNDVSKDLRF